MIRVIAEFDYGKIHHRFDILEIMLTNLYSGNDDLYTMLYELTDGDINQDDRIELLTELINKNENELYRATEWSLYELYSQDVELVHAIPWGKNTMLMYDSWDNLNVADDEI